MFEEMHSLPGSFDRGVEYRVQGDERVTEHIDGIVLHTARNKCAVS